MNKQVKRPLKRPLKNQPVKLLKQLKNLKAQQKKPKKKVMKKLMIQNNKKKLNQLFQSQLLKKYNMKLFRNQRRELILSLYLTLSTNSLDLQQ
jgi:hypothetical protein